MLSFFKKRKPNEFRPTKEMTKEAILKGKRIGLQREEIVEMASLMNKGLAKNKIEKIVDKILTS